MSTKYCFSIPNIACPTCEIAVLNSFILKPTVFTRIKSFFSGKENINGLLYKTITLGEKTISIQDVRVNLSYKQITVTVEENELSAEEVMALLNVELDAIEFSCSQPVSQATVASLPSMINPRWLYGLSGVTAGMALLILPFITGPLSLIAMMIIGVPSVALTLALGAESFKRAAKMLFKGSPLHMDTLFAVSTLTALIASITALFVPGLPMMFEAGLLIFGFKHIGEAIRESLEQSMELTARFQDRAPKRVKKVRSDDHVEEVPTETIKIDDWLLITAGELVAVDGVCETGSGSINRSIEYGSSKDPVSLKPGDKISAGMILVQGSIRMRVTAPACESLLARKDESISNSLNEKDKEDETSWKTESSKVLHYFIPMVFGLALLSGLVVWYFFPLTLAIQSVVAVLVSACPCTLGLITGLAVRVGMKKAADHKIEFKTARKFEEVDQVSHVVFDLNGTLTTTELEITEQCHVSDSNCTYEDFLKYVLMLEAGSTKTVGITIYNYAATKISSAAIQLQPVSIIDKSNHSGVKTSIDGVQYVLGDQNMMKDNLISIASYKHRTLESDERIIYLVRDQMILGHFILQRPLRTEAKVVVNALKKMGKQVHICTGSDEDTAMRYARVLGIPAENVRFDMLCADKVRRIKELQADNKYRVAMIGDEENDADAIAASDFGVAMPTDGLGNMNQQVADAESKVSSLESVAAAFEISRQTGAMIRQNLMFSWTYNIVALLLPVGLLLVTGIALSPGICAALMILQTSLILLNTYRFKQQDLVCLKEAREESIVEEGSSYGSIPSMMPASGERFSRQSEPSGDTLIRPDGHLLPEGEGTQTCLDPYGTISCGDDNLSYPLNG